MKQQKKQETKMQSKTKAYTCMLADEALVGVQLTDRITVPTQRTMTDAGQMHVPCKFARTGSQLYTAKQLGLVDEEPNKMITVHRNEEDVFHTDALESFRSAPVTIGHPTNDDGTPMPVTSLNAKELQVGMLEGMPIRDEETLGGTLVLIAQEAIDAIEEGTQELSAGYVCDIEEVDGKFYQRNIRANHIAIVAKGRAGPTCRVSDSDEEPAYTEEELAKGTKHEMEHTEVESEAAKIAKDHLEEDPQYYVKLAECNMKDELVLTDELKVLTDELASTKVLVDSLTVSLEASEKLVADMEAKAKEKSEEVSVEMTQLKLDLADAKVAAEEGVVERCSAIENARLIADIRDLGDKSVSEIERMVVEDQMPDKNMKDKSKAYISAMFEILVDASKGETPMSKLLKTQAIVDTKVEAKPVNKVELARQKSISRNK